MWRREEVIHVFVVCSCVSYPETTRSPSEEKAQDRTGADWLVRIWSSFMVQAEGCQQQQRLGDKIKLSVFVQLPATCLLLDLCINWPKVLKFKLCAHTHRRVCTSNVHHRVDASFPPQCCKSKLFVNNSFYVLLAHSCATCWQLLRNKRFPFSGIHSPRYRDTNHQLCNNALFNLTKFNCRHLRQDLNYRATK